MTKKREVEIFYAYDGASVKYTAVSLGSIIENANKDYIYNVHVLHTEISEEEKNALSALENGNFKIDFHNVRTFIDNLSPQKDCYFKVNYYKLFIADMFLDVDKAIYIDSDTVVQGDISELYNTDIKDFLVGACQEQIAIQAKEFGDYCERALGNSRYEYLSAGILLINCKLFREKNMLKKFIGLLIEYDFTVMQEQDYLNVLCKDRVLWLDRQWSMGLNPYTEKMKKRDGVSTERLTLLAIEETNREDNYLRRLNKKRSADRVRVREKIDELERCGAFDKEVENDPPTIPLTPDNVNYLNRGIVASAKRDFAFFLARRFFKKALRDKKVFIDGIVGAENIGKCENAIITCNHFNAFDSFVMQYVFDASGHSGRMYRIIREGNYTSFPGFYGFLMRNCNTLPLSSNKEILHMFLKATDTALQTGNCVLIYPEQSMWYNYRKPKPHKSGGFDIAVRNNVPVVPCFITMRDSDVIGEDGYPVQIYKPFVGEPIYPDESLPRGKRSLDLMNKNYEYCKRIYESFYGIPLVYSYEDKI